MLQALVNARVLTDSGFRDDLVVCIEGNRIHRVVARRDLREMQLHRSDLQEIDLECRYLTPGFIDVQVNGGGGVLFNDAPSVEAIRAIGAAHRRFGTTGFLPTLISDDLHVLSRGIDAVQRAIEEKIPGVLGIHIEGPFINEARKGVHDASKFRELDDEAIQLLTSLQGGRTLVTLAPEMTTPQMIARLSAAGVVISAGHTNASYAQINSALENGLTGFTHLFNAMSQLTGREPGTVGAALDSQESWCGIITDGRHVHPAVLRLALRAKSGERFMLVTDAMPTVGSSQGWFELQGRRIKADGLVCIDEDGRLAGSNIDMAASVRNAQALLNISLDEAVRMASQHPAAFLRLDDEYGRIAAGYRANLVVADDEMNVVDTWIDGVRQSTERSIS